LPYYKQVTGLHKLTQEESNFKRDTMDILRAMLLFILAGLAEIGGGWLVWQWLRTGWGLSWGLLGGAVLFLYGVLPTLQTEPALWPDICGLRWHLCYLIDFMGLLGGWLAA
jgi:hypothetical protein